MHIPVLLHESISALNIKAHGIYVDCTTNRAGHSLEIAKALDETGVLICIDLDQDALQEARIVLEKIKKGPKIHFIQSNFRHLAVILKDLRILPHCRTRCCASAGGRQALESGVSRTANSWAR